MLDESGSSKPIVSAISGKPEGIWALRHNISEALRHDGKVIGLDISLTRSQIWNFKEEAKSLLAQKYPYLKICDFGHCADGSDHFNLVWSDNGINGIPYSASLEKEIRKDIYDILCLKYGGSFSSEHGIGPVNQVFYNIYTPQTVRDIASTIKEKLDPAGILTNINLGSDAIDHN